MQYQGFTITPADDVKAESGKLYRVHMMDPKTRLPIDERSQPLFLSLDAAKGFVRLEYRLRQSVYTPTPKEGPKDGQNDSPAS